MRYVKSKSNAFIEFPGLWHLRKWKIIKNKTTTQTNKQTNRLRNTIKKLSSGQSLSSKSGSLCFKYKKTLIFSSLLYHYSFHRNWMLIVLDISGFVKAKYHWHKKFTICTSHACFPSMKSSSILSLLLSWCSREAKEKQI